MRSWGGRRKNETNDIYKRAELSKETRWRGRITPLAFCGVCLLKCLFQSFMFDLIWDSSWGLGGEE